MGRSSGRHRVLAAAAIAVAGCGGAPAVGPRPAANTGEAAIGAMPVPEHDYEVAPVPPELRAAPFFRYPGHDVLRTDLSSLGGRLTIGLPAEQLDSTGGDLSLTVVDDAGTRLDLALGERSYSTPVTTYDAEASRGDAAFFTVAYTDNRDQPMGLAVFRIGDELRIATRTAMRPEAWQVVRVIRLARGAEIHAIQPDPH